MDGAYHAYVVADIMRRVRLDPEEELIHQFLRVPESRTSGGSGRTSPSVAGSMQSDPGSCLGDARYMYEDSDNEMLAINCVAHGLASIVTSYALENRVDAGLTLELDAVVSCKHLAI
ncbi:unnamed protein product [Toxocara canis]|uniref:Beta-lactamase domain-containing protein n=1 Tax=Toxocara canis TaxID=6265 RepID=A0A183V3Y2_TOXCA|nr:unnamed protein product [Toxocara canis]